MKTKYLFLIATLAILFTSCSKEEEKTETSSHATELTAPLTYGCYLTNIQHYIFYTGDYLRWNGTAYNMWEVTPMGDTACTVTCYHQTNAYNILWTMKGQSASGTMTTTGEGSSAVTTIKTGTLTDDQGLTAPSVTLTYKGEIETVTMMTY